MQGTNGGTPTERFTLSSGTLADGEVIVVGTSDMETASTEGGDCSGQFFVEGFQFNGNDALVIELDGTTTDVFGTPGQDPGSAWTGGGVSTRNSNIQLKSGITTGDTDGWTDPSIRFENVGGGTDLTGFGVPTDGCPAVAPVNLSTIEVARLNKAALLTWSTATETGNEFFAIERSEDGRKFEELGRVAGAGDAQTRQDYRFVDQRPLAGVSYYRLRQVDYDGTEEIFGPLAFQNRSDTPKPSIFPNPVTDRVQIQHLDETVEQLTILDAQGRQLSILANSLAKANGGIDVAHLPTGLYFLRFVQAGELHSLRFMKK